MKNFYIKHRTKIWGIIWFLIGSLGANADRLSTYVFPTERLKNLEERVDKLEKTEYNIFEMRIKTGN
jgi:hypothetical protein